MNSIFLISDAAKKVKVEAHVLRYWEEELGLPIKRNELGHRYYTEEDVKRFQEIRDLKEKGLQLKAIKMVLKNGKVSMLPVQEEQMVPGTLNEVIPREESREEKAARLQWLLQQLFREALQENNAQLCQVMKESILKELDYQFRMQEEREDERETERAKKSEEHYKKIDELLRKKRGLLKK